MADAQPAERLTRMKGRDLVMDVKINPKFVMTVVVFIAAAFFLGRSGLLAVLGVLLVVSSAIEK